jgi:hypothetical protein
MAGAFAFGIYDFYRADDYRSRHGSLSERQTRNGGKVLWTTEYGEISTFEFALKSQARALCARSPVFDVRPWKWEFVGSRMHRESCAR